MRIARDYERCLSSMCKHVSNDSYYGKPFLLAEFQRENIWKPLFASGEMTPDGWKRKYRRALFGLPSGFGKTELAAALVLTIATMEVVYNGQYGVVASSKDQVRNIYEKMCTMIKLNEIWSQQWEIAKDIITHKETGARIMILPNKADALESWHFNVLVFDELHVYKDSRVWDAGLKGQKVLNNPLSIGITTAGDRREGFLWETLQNAPNDPAMLTYWLGVEDGKDLEKKSSWKKLLCAPWVTWESILDQKHMATSKRSFERYTANRFPMDKSEYSFFLTSQVEACQKQKNDFDFSQPFTIGIDGATSGDSFAIVLYQKRDGVGYTKEYVFDEPDADLGTYDIDMIEELVAKLYAENYPELVALDPNRLIVFAADLERKYGVETVAFAQNNAVMCQATSLVVDAVKKKKIRLKGCDKTAAHLLNTVELDREPFGSRFGKMPNKQKIDAAIALSLAMLSFESLVDNFEPTII